MSNCTEIKGKTGKRLNHFEVLPLIETALGVHFSYEITNSHPLISRLVFGSIDYCLNIGRELTDGGEELYYARSCIVNSSKAAGIGSPVDAVYPNLDNKEGLERSFSGKEMRF